MSNQDKTNVMLQGVVSFSGVEDNDKGIETFSLVILLNEDNAKKLNAKVKLLQKVNPKARSLLKKIADVAETKAVYKNSKMLPKEYKFYFNTKSALAKVNIKSLARESLSPDDIRKGDEILLKLFMCITEHKHQFYVSSFIQGVILFKKKAYELEEVYKYNIEEDEEFSSWVKEVAKEASAFSEDVDPFADDPDTISIDDLTSDTAPGF